MSNNFFRRLHSELKHGKHTADTVSALQALEREVMTYKFTKFQKPSGYLATIDEPSKIACKELGVTDAQVRRIRSNLSSDAYEYFGSDIFLLVMHEDADGVMRRIGNASKTISDTIIIGEIRSKINDSLASGISLGDCQEEIKYLRKYSLAAIMDEYKRMNPAHIARIKEVLDGPASDTRDQLIRVLSSRD